MKLSYFTIMNYRSIVGSYKINLFDFTTIMGKNNEGKTNVLYAIKLGMDIIKMTSRVIPRRFPKLYYWPEDYPISLQKSNKIKNKDTKLRMDFLLSEEEKNLLFERIGSRINMSLSIFIDISDNNHVSITVPKRGKNAKALTSKVREISQFIVEHFDIQYIPAIRSTDDAYKAISELIESELSGIQDIEYQNALKVIEEKQKERLEILENELVKPLRVFLPSIKRVCIDFNSNDIGESVNTIKRVVDLEIDDGVLTSLSRKGDGVKSLAVMALLSKISTNKSFLILVDEPETHLHPDAVRYINRVLHDVSTRNQVIISTHSSIFVNRTNIASNIIIESGSANSAKRVEDIRNTLGIICSDNLMYSDYVVVVEGPSDKKVLEAFFKEDEKTNDLMQSGFLTVRSIGGTNNLNMAIHNLTDYCCNYLVVLDYDQAGKEALNRLKTDNHISVKDDRVMFFKVNGKNYSELEDIYKEEVYKDYLLNKGLDIRKDNFKNKSMKWVERIKCLMIGRDLTDDEENTYKKEISDLVCQNISDSITSQGLEILNKVKKIIIDDSVSIKSIHVIRKD